ncbi:MAG TPA: FtsX-like permease family protein [Anaerolineales bacterium]|nr:FtsX-like permease family protein [Anaerolineales bacterium]
MLLYLRLAWRNIWRHTRRTIIIVLAMSLTLALMMFYDGLMAGFTNAIYGNAVKVLGGNIQVHAQGYRAQASSTPLLPLADPQAVIKAAQASPLTLAATQRINTGGLVTSREGAFSVGITGVEPEQEMPVNIIGQYVKQGRNLTSSDADNILIGKGLAEAMGVQVGDRITLVGRAQHNQMRQRTMTVVGIFDLGMTDIEKQTVYISLGEAQSLYDLPGQSTEVAVFLKQLGEEGTVIKSMKSALPSGYEVESFEANYPDLASLINTKGGVMNVFSVIIIAIAGVGILNLLLMAVYERTREIGVLGAMGLKPRQISLLFILEGTMIGLVGVAVGIVLGLAVNGILMQVGLDFGSMTQAASYMALLKGRAYPTWGVEKLLIRASMVTIISALAAVIPAMEAGQREPAEALHFV